MVKYIKCSKCGNYDEFDELEEYEIKSEFSHRSYDLCADCLAEEKKLSLEYDAYECGYDSADEYLAQENYKQYFKDK